MVLQVSLACQRPHPERKEISVRSPRRIDKGALSAGLSAICVNNKCSNVDIVVSQYNDNDNDNECFILTYELIMQIIYSTMIDQYSHSQGNYIMTYISLACNYRKIFFKYIF